MTGGSLVQFAALVGCVAALAVQGAEAQTPHLESVERIWNHGNHNAFTDLIRFQDEWFCTFREADGHVGGDGQLRVLASRDGQWWKPVALLSEPGVDLRDPKLSLTPDGRLMIVAGGSVYNDELVLQGRQPRVAFSPDGRHWSRTLPVLDQGEWLWRVTWRQGVAYGVTYNAFGGTAAPTEFRRGYVAHLVSSTDGLDFQPVTRFDLKQGPGETTVRLLDQGKMLALVRCREGSVIGASQPPYTDWNWHELPYRLGGPNFIALPDGSLWASSRIWSGSDHQSGRPATMLIRMTENSFEPVLELPSGGDNSYAGMVWHNDRLWMSYYSSHEGKSSIYLAKIRFDP